MALLNFLKKKEEKKPVKKKPAKKPVKKEPIKVEKKEEMIKPQAKKKISGIGYKVLHSPHITEKASKLTEENKYVFKVLPNSNKNEIKKAIKDTYGVDVINVRVINVPRRKTRLGRHEGWKKGYRKAIAEIKKGQKIEIMPR